MKFTIWLGSLCVVFLGLVESANGGFIFWADQGNVYRAGLNGENQTQIHSGSTGWVEVDRVAQKVYVRNSTGGG